MPFSTPAKMRTQHEVAFYCDDQTLVESLTQFIGSALRVGNSAIVISTAPNRDRLLVQLQQCGLHIGAAVEHGKYMVLDAVTVLSTIVVDGHIDEFRFFALFDDLIRKAADAAREGQCRVEFSPITCTCCGHRAMPRRPFKWKGSGADWLRHMIFTSCVGIL